MAEINDSLFENFFELWDNMIRNGVFQFVFVAFTLYIKVHFIFYVMHTFAKLLSCSTYFQNDVEKDDV